MRRDGLVSIIRPGDALLYPPLEGPARRRAMRDMLFSDHGIVRSFFNTRRRISDEMSRSSQPLPYQVRAAAKRGIKTLINLRGPSDTSFYRIEEEFALKNGLTLVNFAVYSREAPLVETVLSAKAMFDTIEYPALMHCKSGADRVGLMSALYLILRQKRPVREAKKQLSLRHGHVKQAKTGILDYFLQSYLDYSANTPIDFLDWVMTVYDRDAVTASFHARWWANVLTDKIMRRE
jgi:protein tyrosine/serine phosphatase